MFYSGDSGENPISFVEIDIRARKEKRNLFFIFFRARNSRAITEKTEKTKRDRAITKEMSLN